jgi:hypothetical protein
MKMAAAFGTSILGLILGNPAFLNAQHGHDDEHGKSQKEHGNDRDKDKDHGRSAAHHSDSRHDQQREHENREHQQAHQEPNHGQARSREVHEQHAARHDAWQDHRAKHWEHEHRTWHERGGYRGYRIPDDRFRAHFGRGHWFRVHSAPVIVVGGYPRFQYGGFWFSVVDPWPEYWARTWYETDDVYVDYAGDGYYMYNRRHPGVAIAVNVSF